MRITVRGWGRDLGETEIMSGAVAGAEIPDGTYSLGKLYKKVEHPENKRLTKVRISTSTKVHLGGTYLLHVELSRKEIAELFFDTHKAAMVRMIQSFIEDEERAQAREDHAQMLEYLAARERRQGRLTQEDQTEPQDS